MFRNEIFVFFTFYTVRPKKNETHRIMPSQGAYESKDTLKPGFTDSKRNLFDGSQGYPNEMWVGKSTNVSEIELLIRRALAGSLMVF